MVDFSKDKFFENLLRATATHGTVYLVEDGNVYTEEGSALRRVENAKKLQEHLRFAEIVKDQEPMSAAEVEELFVKNDARLRKEEVSARSESTEVVPSFALTEAEAARKLAERRNKAKGGKSPELENVEEEGADDESPIPEQGNERKSPGRPKAGGSIDKK